MPISRHSFSGANVDDDDSVRPASAYVAGLNLSLEPGHTAPMRGNVAVPGYALPTSGTTRSLGGLPDGATGTAVYLLYNSSGAHRLVRYNPAGNGGAGQCTTLLEWAGLNLLPTLPIGEGVNGGILDGLFIYRDGGGELRCINLARAAAGTYTADYLAAEPFALHLAKVPPTSAPTATRQLAATGAPGEALRIIQNKAYQFSYRYRYVDGEVTVLAPYSGWLDVLTDPSQVTFNTISIALPSTIPAGVLQIEMLVRDANGLAWQVADTLQRDSNGQFVPSFSFYGQILGAGVPEAEASRPYESLWPCEAGPTLARNRPHAAVFTEGYVTPQPAFTATVGSATATDTQKATLHERSTYRVAIQFFDALGRSGGCSRPQTVRVPSRTAGTSTLRTLTVNLTTTDPNALNAEIPDWATTYVVLVARNDRTIKFIQGQAADTLGYSGEKRTINNDSGVITQTHRFSDVNNSNHQKTWVDIGNFPATGQGYVWEVGDVLYIRDIDKEFVISKQEGDYLEIPYTGGIPKNGQGLTVPFIEIYTPNTTPGALYYERGPRLRVLRDSQGNRTYEQSTIALEGDCYLVNLFFPNIIRSEAYAFDSNNNKDFEPATAATVVESMVPPFRLAPTSTITITDYQEVKRGVLDGGLFGLISDREDVTVRTSTVTTADTAARPASSLLWLDMSFSGRESVVIPLSLQRVRRNITRFGGQKQQGNLINGLSRWEALSQYDKIPQEQGDIVAMASAQAQTGGSVLVVLQQRGATSLYLNQQPIQTDPNQQLLAITPAVIGGDNTQKGGFGCTDPASLVPYGGKLFYWCRERQELLRYHNGTEPLGLTYKFSQRLQQTARLYGDAPVHASFDPRRQEYHLTFASFGALPGRTLVWSERRLAWADEVSYVPEAGFGFSNELVTFQAGALYRHTPTAAVGTFFGVTTAPVLTITVASADETAKRWMSIEQRTEGEAWNLTSFATSTGQQSRTHPDWWQRREGVHLLPEGLKRAENTPGFTNQTQALYEGNPLISPRATLTFTCPDTNAQPMSEIAVSWLPRSGQTLGVSA